MSLFPAPPGYTWADETGHYAGMLRQLEPSEPGSVPEAALEDRLWRRTLAYTHVNDAGTATDPRVQLGIPADMSAGAVRSASDEIRSLGRTFGVLVALMVGFLFLKRIIR